MPSLTRWLLCLKQMLRDSTSLPAVQLQFILLPHAAVFLPRRTFSRSLTKVPAARILPLPFSRLLFHRQFQDLHAVSLSVVMSLSLVDLCTSLISFANVLSSPSSSRKMNRLFRITASSLLLQEPHIQQNEKSNGSMQRVRMLLLLSLQ